MLDAMLRSICAMEMPTVRPGRKAITVAEQWANSRVAKAMAASSTYPNGKLVDFSELAPKMSRVAVANKGSWTKAVRAVESASLAPRALRTYKQRDAESVGYMQWDTGEIAAFVIAVFQQHVLVPPDEKEIRFGLEQLGGPRCRHLDARE
eukprot:1782972-Amphidinium_carterae.1